MSRQQTLYRLQQKVLAAHVVRNPRNGGGYAMTRTATRSFQTHHPHPPEKCATTTSASLDHSYVAHHFGYRVVVRQPPTISAIRGMITHSSSTTYDDYYNDVHNPLHYPENLDILKSPEVLEILEAQREWDHSLKQPPATSILESNQDEGDPEYFSDYEAMDEEQWEEYCDQKTTEHHWADEMAFGHESIDDPDTIETKRM
jgi:hypothetical protein